MFRSGVVTITREIENRRHEAIFASGGLTADEAIERLCAFWDLPDKRYHLELKGFEVDGDMELSTGETYVLVAEE